LINALSEANVSLADKEYQQGLKEIGDEAAQAAIGLLEFTDAVELQGSALAGVQGAISSYLDSIGTLKEGISSLTQSAFKGLEDAIVSLTTTGTFNFRAFALSIIEETTRMVTRLLIIAPILQFLQSLIPGGGALSGTNALSTTKLVPGGIFAKGGTFANGIQPFASGGIVNSPTLFKFANGGAMRNGLMGEAGPEAIIPLKRGRDGKLGVAGGGGTSVVVNVDAKGTSVQGNSGQGEQLGRAISQAVQAELIKQKRPGGLLAA
jgi:lambda family phage tail tape measure protein